jgi:AraC-like DNA-binding protein
MAKHMAKIKGVQPMNNDRDFAQWEFVPMGDIEVVTARMGPCGLGKHFHDTWSLGVIVQGSCHFASHQRQYQVSQSQLFVIPPYEVHVCAAAADNVAYQVIYVTDSTLQTLAPTLRTVFLGHDLRVHSLPPALVQALLNISRIKDDVVALRACFKQLDAVFRNTGAGIAAKPQHAVQDALHAGWNDAIDLKTVSESIKYSRWHAIHSFSAQVGLSPRLYLRQLRALKARHMLWAGNSLAAVAGDLHFADQSHFSRAFKSVFGVSPGKLQRVMQSKLGVQAKNRQQQQQRHPHIEAVNQPGATEY